ncbi:MAG: ABC transporter ATP-binding protein/permease [Mollicutes bacterium]|nr:ABC transporter ATP-binding protein/permease [Mollicutes bacterium]
MNNEKENKTPKRMHGPGRGPGEKPKDFKKALLKLKNYLKPYMHLIIIAVILSALSSILSIVGPNKIKDLTNEIQQGLIVNKSNIELLVEDIQKDIKQNIVLNEKDLESLSNEDKVIYYEVLSKMNNSENKETLILELPESVKLLIFKDTTIKGSIITNKDKLEFVNIMSNFNMDEPTKIYKDLDKLSKNVNELIKPKMNLDKVKDITIFLVCLYLISAIFGYFENYLMVIASNNFAKSLRTKISKKINKLPLKYFDKNSYGDVLSRVTNDVDTINMSLQNSLGTFVGAVSLFIGCIIMMFVTNYIMAITCILSSLFGFAFMSIILSKSQKYFNQRQIELGNLNGHIEEIYSSHNVVKAYNGEKESLEKFNNLNKKVYDCNRKSQFLSGLMQPMMGFIGNFSYVAICIVGAVLTLKGNTTFGTIVAFMIYVRLFTSPLSQIAQSMTQLQTASAASERVFEFIEEAEMKDESSLTGILEPKKVKGNIDFEHVKFGYDNDKTIIKDFNCKVKPGQKVAIVGPTGAGKTTIVNLLMKFYEINSGDIKIDGMSINNLTRENIHDLFIMVLQDTWLFEGTIRDNIKFNKDDVSDKEIWDALKVVGVDHFVKSLPKTLDYKIEDNESISAGQKQLLTIARGMIEDAPFLILDEATSSVDTRTEELVQKAMDKLTEGRTSFIIAHRLSTIKNADIILVMKDGNIIETGSHDELMKKNGFYAELYNSQFQN